MVSAVSKCVRDMRVLKELWFITTDHLTDRIWFRDDEDFKMGMNLVAILACTLKVDVLAFTLMSNHVHFVLACTHEEAEAFIDEYKRRYAQYFRRRYGLKEYLRGNGYRIDPIDGNEESLEWVIAYVQMNCVAANICLSPTGYLWGTGNSFFTETQGRWHRLGDYSKCAARRLLHTMEELPPHLLISDSGYILPESYVNVEFVETVFRTPKRMLYFLQNSSKAKRRLSAESDAPAFRDQVIVAAIPDLCQSLFRKPNLAALSEADLTELLKQLRYRFSANVNQLARTTGLPYQKVALLLDMV